MNKPRGFIKPRYCYEVRISDPLNQWNVYHAGFAKRAAMQAFDRAQKGGKGSPAPSVGKRLVFMKSGRILHGVDANGNKFRI